MRASFASTIAVLLGALLVAPHAFAHHSFAPHFDSSKPANISGTITEFEARNPHSYLHIAAIDENGRTRDVVGVETLRGDLTLVHRYVGVGSR